MKEITNESSEHLYIKNQDESYYVKENFTFGKLGECIDSVHDENSDFKSIKDLYDYIGNLLESGYDPNMKIFIDLKSETTYVKKIHLGRYYNDKKGYIVLYP